MFWPPNLLRRWRYCFWRPQAVFADIYRRNAWGSPESRSGAGSEWRHTEILRPALADFFLEKNIQTVLDVPCGDFHWFSQMDLTALDYTGGDIVPELVARNQAAWGNDQRRFVVLDLLEDDFPAADALLVRDALVHFSHKQVHRALDNIRRAPVSWVLLTHFPQEKKNREIVTGAWRPLNLCAAPFHWPEPDLLLPDLPEWGKFLGVWKLDGLR